MKYLENRNDGWYVSDGDVVSGPFATVEDAGIRSVPHNLPDPDPWPIRNGYPVGISANKLIDADGNDVAWVMGGACVAYQE